MITSHIKNQMSIQMAVDRNISSLHHRDKVFRITILIKDNHHLRDNSKIITIMAIIVVIIIITMKMQEPS